MPAEENQQERVDRSLRGRLRRRAARAARGALNFADRELSRSITPDLEPTFFSRFECKYCVDPIVVPEMREFLRPWVEPDSFAALCPDYRYPVCSLYLDSEDLLTYHQTVGGERSRFKLRVRTYSDDPRSLAYFEVKKKVNSIVYKRRAGLSRERARALLTERPEDLLRGLPAELLSDIEYFRTHTALAGARPVLRVKYLREAYQSADNEPVRITIDTDLMHCVTLDDTLSHVAGRWVGTPTPGTIIELKFTERYPSWAQDFVRAFGLHQRAVPKYVMSMDHVLLDGRESALAFAGLTLPPRRA